MNHPQAIKLALECLDTEIKRLAPLANQADPPPGLMPHRTPMSIRAAERRTLLRQAKDALTQKELFV